MIFNINVTSTYPLVYVYVPTPLLVMITTSQCLTRTQQHIRMAKLLKILGFILGML